MDELPAYDEKRCQKCGAISAKTRYCEKCDEHETEHVHRSCKRCGYHWLEAIWNGNQVAFEVPIRELADAAIEGEDTTIFWGLIQYFARQLADNGLLMPVSEAALVHELQEKRAVIQMLQDGSWQILLDQLDPLDPDDFDDDEFDDEEAELN